MFLVTALIAWMLSGVPAPPQVPSPVTGAPATVLTLREAIDKARARSGSIAASREREQAASLAMKSVAQLPNPFVEVRGENFSGVPSATLPRDAFVTISQPIELGGKRGARTAIEAALHQRAVVDVTAAESTVAGDVADLYIEALRSRDVMATLVEQREGLSEIIGILGQRVREGLSPEADLRRFETEQTRLKSQITRSTVALQAQVLRLSALIGEPVRPEQLMTPLVPATSVASPAAAADVRNRADVRAAEARLQHAESASRLEHSRAVPDLTMTAGYKRTSGYDTGVAAVTLPIGIFDRNRSAIAHAQGDVSAARLELQAVRERALADAQARSATAVLLTDQASRVDQDLVTPARVVRTAARSAFTEGRVDVLQLVDAERVYSDALREALELRLDATLAIIHARLAIGENPLP